MTGRANARRHAVIRGLIALSGLAVLVAGVPAVLWAVGGAPVSGGWPAPRDVWDAATRPDDGTLFLDLLVLGGWAGWATFALGLLVEVPAALRGTVAPRLPGLGAQQRLVAGLVAAVAALGSGAQVASAGSSPQGPWEPAPPVTTDLLDQQPPAVEGDAADSDADESDAATHDADTYVVSPGDTLWDIAGARLGDPLGYPEIFTASSGTVQPDGRRLTDPDLIVPGWTLTLPAASAPAADLPDTGGEATGETAGETADGATAETTDETAGESADGATAELLPRRSGVVAGEAVGAVGGAADSGSACLASADTGVSDADADAGAVGIARTAGGVGAVLAASFVGVLAARRARRQRRRRPGQRLAAGTETDRAAETELRQAADPAGVEFVDLALRTLAGRLAGTGRGLPALRAVRLTGRALELYLAAPAELPAPFVGTAHGGVWTVAIGAAGVLGDDRAAAGPAPYPSLVTLGHDGDDALVLLDLEQLGTLAVDGPPEVVRGAMTAMAAELATSGWADDLRVTLVGGSEWADLDQLESGRIRHVTDVDGLLDEITVRVTDDRLLLATAGVSGLGAARVAQVADATWTPEILLVADPLPADQRRRLDALIEAAPRVAVAAVVRGDVVRAGWALRVESSPAGPTAVLEPPGVIVRPQLLDDAGRQRVLELLRIADTGSADGESEPVDPTLTAPAATRSDAAAVPRPRPDRGRDGSSPRLIMLGRVAVEHTAELGERSKLGQLTELAMYIALNPGCDADAIDEAIWPGSAVTKITRSTAVSKLRRWLGTNAQGESLLPRTEGRYTFLPGIRSDWQDWCDLLAEGPARATTADLRAALDLVKGRPFTGRGRRRYAWVDHLAQEMIASIVDACHELALRALVDRDPWEALRVALLGLSIEPGVELLWRDRLKAEIAIGDRATVIESIGKLRSTADDLGGDLEPETEELIDRILPPGDRLSATG